MKHALTAGMAFIVFAVLHSLTVSGTLKSFAVGIIGERRMMAFYRLGFTLFSLAITVIFVVFYIGLPDTFIYRPDWYILWPAHALQLTGVWIMAAAMKPFDTGYFTGVSQASAYLRSGATSGDIEGITPASLTTKGVYGLVRHPMYLAGIVAVAFEPNITMNCLTVRALAVLYFVYGAVAEDARLVRQFGNEYTGYKKAVPMLNILAGIRRRYGQGGRMMFG